MNSSPIRLLLADDDEDDRELFQEALREIPLVTRLTTVADGFELMARLAENPGNLPDLLFLDMNMPRKNGLTCLEEIRQNAHWQHLPVSITSTALIANDVQRLYALGAQYYIKKPPSFEELVRMIETILYLPPEKLRNRPSPEEFVLISK